MARPTAPQQIAARNLILAPFALERAPQTAAADAAPVPASDDPLGEREFEGIASAYGVVFYRLDTERWERVPTILEPAAWNDAVASINGRPGDRAGRVPLLRNHYALLGRTLRLAAASDGLRFRARVTDEPEAMAWYAHILAGAADGISVGFGIEESNLQTHSDRGGEKVEHVTRASLVEVTSCVFGANPGAMVESAASADLPASVRPAATNGSALAMSRIDRELTYAHERIDTLEAQLRPR